MANTKAEVAAHVAWNCGAQLGESPDILTFNKDLLTAEIESVLSAAESNLARKVLKEIESLDLVSDPAVKTYGRKRLLDLFIRLNVKID